MSLFGKELKKYRAKHGWTLREVQGRSGVSRQTVLRAEAGELISLDVLLKLFSIYDVKGKSKDKLMAHWVNESIVRARATRRRKTQAVARATA